MMWQTVIGLEVHAQLKTSSKLFSGTSTIYGAPANTQTSYIDAGLPGVLPVLNQRAVHLAIQFGLAIGADINTHCFFERKNYFYPDLPKGYQISQFQSPIVSNGYLEIEPGHKIHIVRAHLEEDAGKSLHEAATHYTGIDLNRSGTPLLEIVTAPCLSSAKEAISYLKTLHQLLLFLDICDGNMQEGSFRCDVNLSLKPHNSPQLGTRTELKNLNSFRFIEKAIYYEEARHQDMLESGRVITQETRLYCPDTDTTQVLRNKENENDYRYFPDPDLLPIKISEHDIARLKAEMPPTPSEIKKHLQQENLSPDQITFLLTSPALFKFYQRVREQSHAEAKTVFNWLKSTYTAAIHSRGLSFDTPPVSADQVAYLLDRLTDKVIPTTIAKAIFAQLVENNTHSIDELILASGYQKPSDTSFIDDLILETINAYPQQVADYRAGKEKLLAFFVGQVMKQTKGQVDPAQINVLIRKYLSRK